MEPYEKILDHISKRVSLTDDEKKQIRDKFTLRRYRKKELLAQQNEPCKYENYLIDGIARFFFVDQKGEEHTLQFAIEDWWITELESFTSSTPSQYYIEAMDDTRVLQITAPRLDELYQSIPAMEKFFRILHQKAYIAQNKRILQNIQMTGRERYLHFIDEFPSFHDLIPQKFIASYLGMTPVFLSQIRKGLATR